MKQMIAIRIQGYPNGGKGFLNSLERAQINNESETLNLALIDIEHELVLCPINSRQITRGECLEYSGESEHWEECKNCDIGLENKKLLTPPEQEHI